MSFSSIIIISTIAMGHNASAEVKGYKSFGDFRSSAQIRNRLSEYGNMPLKLTTTSSLTSVANQNVITETYF
ncbi:unnamed protein product [Adineta steineri]|uniref:Uncharacterized protein n=1 Tax=Adineta steineri TaxID=433720 RepID=A0A815SF66_9BILA|nr:unnamed protein product [Adineta steineri]